MSIVDTLLGRSSSKALVAQEPLPLVEVPAQKAAIGAGAWALEHHTPLTMAVRHDTEKFMKRAQQISHSAPWVATCERIISGKVGTIPWHLEDREGEAIDDTGTGPVADFRRLIERPNPHTTRRELWQLTSRHLGVCGNAFWFLDQRNAVTNAPLQILYINPARMTPAQDKAGYLTGWVLDAESEYEWGSGTPVDIEEVLHFVFEPPDWGHFGHGIVESALSKIEITRYADRYTSGVMGAGGKRGGIASAKEGMIPDEAYQSLVNNFRNIAESPDATKRTIVTQGAIDYTFTSATPQELELSEVSALSRDDTFGIWGVPLSQAGIMSARGLNSGETVKYEEAALWQGACHPRVVAMWEVIQYQLIDRINPDWQLILEEPTFDDNQPLFELADLAKTQPLRNIERREILGLEPFGDERDEEVWLPQGFERIYPEPGEGEVSPPAPVPLALLGSTSEDQEEAEDDAEEATRAKASLGPLATLRSKIERTDQVAIQKAVESFLADQRDHVVKRLAERARHFLQKPRDASALLGKNWDAELAKVLLPLEAAIATETAAGVRKIVPKATKADPFEADAVEFARTRAGERITGINGTTRDAVLREVQDVIDNAVRQGLGPSEVAGNLTDRVGKMTVWNDARANLIARTETMFAYNDAALKSYDRLGVTHVVAFDGDKDAECADRDGREFSIEESYEIADHPNGTLDWGPVVKASTAAKATVSEAEPNVVRLEMHEPPAPVVHVKPPIVNVAAPVVDTAPFEAAIHQLRAEFKRPVRKRIVRDAAGLIVEVIEE